MTSSYQSNVERRKRPFNQNRRVTGDGQGMTGKRSAIITTFSSVTFHYGLNKRIKPRSPPLCMGGQGTVQAGARPLFGSLIPPKRGMGLGRTREVHDETRRITELQSRN